MRVGFTGTRLGPTIAQHQAMARFLIGMPITRFVHGGGGHSDTLAHRIVSANGLARQVVIEIHPGSDVPKSTVVTIPMGNCEIYPELPALQRNRVIVSRIYGLLAVPMSDTEDRSGTWTTVRYARELGCPVYLITKAGRIVRDIDPAFI